MISSNHQTPESLESLARAAQGESQWDDATQYWEELLKRKPRHRRAMHFLPYTRFLQGAGPVVCNICGCKEFIDFNKRLRVRCAECHALTRTRFLALYIDRLTLPENARILHIAPDNGLSQRLMARYAGTYRCADVNARRYRNRKNFVRADLCVEMEKLRLEAGYDLIIHSHVLEHLPCNYAAVLLRLNGLLSEHGRQLIQLPLFTGHFGESLAPLTEAARKFNKKHFHQANHLRKFGTVDLERSLGMLFDVTPYMHYDMRDHVPEDILTKHNISSVFWQGLSISTIFDIAKHQMFFEPRT